MSSGNFAIPYHNHHPNQSICNLPARATTHLDTLITYLSTYLRRYVDAYLHEVHV